VLCAQCGARPVPPPGVGSALADSPPRRVMQPEAGQKRRRRASGPRRPPEGVSKATVPVHRTSPSAETRPDPERARREDGHLRSIGGGNSSHPRGVQAEPSQGPSGDPAPAGESQVRPRRAGAIGAATGRVCQRDARRGPRHLGDSDPGRGGDLARGVPAERGGADGA
jgi:hypothetical protein